MMKFFKKSKKGITLVESVFAVVILGILTIGILTLLTTGGMKIAEISSEAEDYSQAVQKMDLVISAISNGYGNIVTDGTSYKLEFTTGSFDFTGLSDPVPSEETYNDGEPRGWYLQLTYEGITVEGYVSNTKGVFDTK